MQPTSVICSAGGPEGTTFDSFPETSNRAHLHAEVLATELKRVRARLQDLSAQVLDLEHLLFNLITTEERR